MADNANTSSAPTDAVNPAAGSETVPTNVNTTDSLADNANTSSAPTSDVPTDAVNAAAGSETVPTNVNTTDSLAAAAAASGGSETVPPASEGLEVVLVPQEVETTIQKAIEQLLWTTTLELKRNDDKNNEAKNIVDREYWRYISSKKVKQFAKEQLLNADKIELFRAVFKEENDDNRVKYIQWMGDHFSCIQGLQNWAELKEDTMETIAELITRCRQEKDQYRAFTMLFDSNLMSESIINEDNANVCLLFNYIGMIVFYLNAWKDMDVTIQKTIQETIAKPKTASRDNLIRDLYKRYPTYEQVLAKKIKETSDKNPIKFQILSILDQIISTANENSFINDKNKNDAMSYYTAASIVYFDLFVLTQMHSTNLDPQTLFEKAEAYANNWTRVLHN